MPGNEWRSGAPFRTAYNATWSDTSLHLRAGAFHFVSLPSTSFRIKTLQPATRRTTNLPKSSPHIVRLFFRGASMAPPKQEPESDEEDDGLKQDGKVCLNFLA